jgi:hypothetical protein
MSAHFSWYLSGGSDNANPSQSLGGPRSTVAVVPANLFPDVSAKEAATGGIRHRGIYVLNDGDKKTQDTFLWIQTDNSSTYDALSIATASEGFNIIMQTIVSESTPPVGVLFNSGRSKGFGLFLGNFDIGAYIGVWIGRNILAGADSFDNSSFSLRVEGLEI